MLPATFNHRRRTTKALSWELPPLLLKAAEAKTIETKTERKGWRHHCFSFSTFAFVVTTPPGISSSLFGGTRRPFSVNYHRCRHPPPLCPIKKDEQTTLDGTQCSFNWDHSAFFFYRVLPSTSDDEETLMANKSLDGGRIYG